MGRRLTQGDVARIAGTSTAVVSYVLNNGPRPVSADTRRRVLAAIESTGYRPNTAARALVSGRSAVFGLVVPDLANPFLAQLVQNLEREFYSRGYSLLVGDSEDDADREVTAVETLLAQQVAGLAWYTIDQPPPLHILRSSSVPIVLLNGHAPPADSSESSDFVQEQAHEGGRIAGVATDEKEFTRVVTEHLLAHGRRRIGHLGGPPERLNSQRRAQGWKETVASAGLEPAVQINAPFTRAGGRSVTQAVIEADCDAIVTANEMQAVGLMAGLALAGVRVPDDLAIVALNGTDAANYTVPSLTTVCLSEQGFAADVADALAPDSEVLSITTGVDLVLRRSCGCAEPNGELAG